MVKISKKDFVIGQFAIYKKMMGTSVYSPALNAEVRFTRKAWGHMVHNGRHFKDVYRRIMLIPLARPILSTIKTVQNVRPTLEPVFFTICSRRKVTINGKSSIKQIKVVVLKDRACNYTFLSICDGKV